jgi:hypothetical protein
LPVKKENNQLLPKISPVKPTSFVASVSFSETKSSRTLPSHTGCTVEQCPTASLSQETVGYFEEEKPRPVKLERQKQSNEGQGAQCSSSSLTVDYSSSQHCSVTKVVVPSLRPKDGPDVGERQASSKPVVKVDYVRKFHCHPLKLVKVF